MPDPKWVTGELYNEANQEPPVDQTHQGGTGLDSRGKGKGRPSGSKSSRTQADEEDEEGPGQDVQEDGRCVHMSQVFFFSNISVLLNVP